MRLRTGPRTKVTHRPARLNAMALDPARAPKALGLLAVVVLGPVGSALAVMAAFFLARQFVSGWIPGDWWSDSFADWVIGFGQKGSASSYFGFMVTAVPAAMCMSGARWGLDVLKRPVSRGSRAG